MSKIKITYAKHKTTFDGDRDKKGNPIEHTMYFFYPNGIWDEDKLTKQEAEQTYPRTKYQWVLDKNN